MASFVYNNAKVEFLKGNLDWEVDTFKILLLSASHATANPDHVYVTQVTASEVTSSTYVAGFAGSGRKTLSSKTVTVDNTNDRAVADAADVTWSPLSCGHVGAAVVIKEVATDNDSLVIAFLDGTDFHTTGDYVQLTFNSGGLFYF